jgi:transcriptional regulator PpsR
LDFSEAERHLGMLHASSAASLLAASGDLVVLLNEKGVVLDLACGGKDFASWNLSEWIGRSWEETVTGESVVKIRMLLQDARREHLTQSRQVNHPSVVGNDLPIAYRVASLPGGESTARFAAIGRDLRDTTRMQQRLVAAQAQMERDHWQAQDLQTRAHALIQLSRDALLVLEPDQWGLVEANMAAHNLLGPALGQAGWTLLSHVDSTAKQALIDHAAQLQSSSGPRVTRFEINFHGHDLHVALQRAETSSGSHWLLCLTNQSPALSESEQNWAPLAASAPDALLISDSQGVIRHANLSFLRAVQCTSPEQVLGTSLETWLGRQEVDQSVLLSYLKQHGSVRLFATELRGALGASTEVEISAAAIGENRPARYGFVLRDVSRRLDETPKELPRTASEMTELVGRLPLKDIVRETTDLIEQLCIQAALELTGDNRASAAEMLGLSRQSLYIKLRRFQLVDGTDDTKVNTESQP